MAATVTVDFNANLARFSSSIDKATNDLNKFQSNTARIAGNIKSAFGILGAGFVVAGIGNAIRETADFADEMGKAAQKVGTTAESLSALKYAGELADVTFEQLQTGMGKLAKTAEDFRNGMKTAVDAFAKIGIDPTKFKDTSDLFAAVAEKLSKMEGGARKTAIAMELLGRSGAQMIPLLNAGKAGLQAAADEAERFGKIVSSEAAAKAEEFNDNITRLSSSLEGLRNTLAGGLVGDIADLTTQFLDAAQAADGFWGALVGSTTNKDQLGQDLAEVRGRLDELKRMRAELDPSKGFANQLNEAIFGDVNTINQQIKVAQQEYNTLLKMKELADKRLNQKPSGPTGQPIDSPAAAKKSSVKSSVDRDAEAAKRFVEALTKEAATLGLAGTALKAYEAAHLKLTPSQQAVVADTLKKINAFNQEAESLKALNEMLENHQQVMDDFNQRELEGIEQDSSDEASRAEDFERQAQAIREMLDPAIALYNELGKIQALGSLGLLDSEEVEDASKKIQEEFDKLAAKTDETADAMTEFWKQAAANMQDAMADLFFDAMQGKLSDLAGSFKQTIDRMVANLMASQLLKFLTGDFGTTGEMGGVVGEIFSKIPKFATGTDYVPRDMLAVVHKGEKIIPAAQNRPGASGGGSNVVYMTVNTPNADSFRKSQQQIAADMQRALNGARRVS